MSNKSASVGIIPGLRLLMSLAVLNGSLTVLAQRTSPFGGSAIYGSEVLDLRTASFGTFQAAFAQLADGLEYTDDGEIVSAPGKRLQYNEATRAALVHLIVRTRPAVTLTLTSVCSSCGGNPKKPKLEGREGFGLGNVTSWICPSCSGKGSFTETKNYFLTYSGELPRKWDSPSLIAFRGRLNSARNGDSVAQLEVAKACMQGRFMVRNAEEARDWLVKSAAQGQREALGLLSALYLDPANSAFHDLAFGSALAAVADPSLARQETPAFFMIRDAGDVPSTADAALAGRLKLLEAGFLAPRIAKGLTDQAEAEKVLSPQSLREGFAPQSPLTAETQNDRRALFVRGASLYLGLGHAAPDPKEALRNMEAAASLSDADALLFIAMHFDAAKEYPASRPGAWAFYSIAKSLGSSDAFCDLRLSQFAEDEVSADWAGVPELLLARLKQGRVAPQAIRALADLSFYRTLSVSGADQSARNPYETGTSQETPLTAQQVFSQARSLLHARLKVIVPPDKEEMAFRKTWDDGALRFYSASGVVTFLNADARRETAPFTICFKTTGAHAEPVFLQLSAGSVREGEMPVECGRRADFSGSL